MEIRELNFMENLSDNGKETLVKDSVIGGHGYDYSYSYDLHSYFPYPTVHRLRDDFRTRRIEVNRPEPEPEVLPFIGGGAGIPGSPFP